MKRRMNWALPALLVMVLFIGALAVMQSLAATSPDPARLATQCGACHTMDTEVESWKSSSHKDVACTACHADPGVSGWLKSKYGNLQMTMASADVDKGSVATEVPNERCVACHAPEMPYVMQDLKPWREDGPADRSMLAFLPGVAGHDVHLTAEPALKCTECHWLTSHGPSKRPDRVELMHKTCLDCHTEKKVPLAVRNSISCSACHLEMPKVSPPDHKDAGFKDRHGKLARKDAVSCQQCHLNPGMATKPDYHVQTAAYPPAVGDYPHIPKFAPGSLAISPKTEDSCAACHGVTMPHPQEWLTKHATGFQEKPELCASCHGNQEKGFTSATPKNPRTIPTEDPTCTNCHAVPMPHPDGYAGTAHSIQAQAKPQTCVQCHSSANPVDSKAPHASPQYCLDCHSSKFRHPTNWVANHEQAVATAGGSLRAAGCTQCHTPTENTCTSCHTGGVGQTQQWHPKEWVGTHKTAVAVAGGSQQAAGCTTCHSVKQSPSQKSLACTECHTSGLGQKQEWHPAMWWIKHGNVVKQQGEATCASCHNYIQPSCAQCHRGR